MADYAVVLNAGSSSLKFSVYGDRRLGLAVWKRADRSTASARSPRFTASDGAGVALADERLDARRGQARRVRRPRGVAPLALRRRPRAGRRPPRRPRRRRGTPARRSSRRRSSTDLRALIPLAPLHQPYNLAAIEAVSERLPGVPQVACFDTSFHRGQPAVAEMVPLPREICRGGVQRYGFHGLSYEYIASVLPHGGAGASPRGRVIVAHLGSGASLCAMNERQERGQHARVHRARRTLHGNQAGSDRSRRGSLSLPGSRALRQGGRNHPLQEVGPARHLRDQQRHARPARAAASPAHGSRWTTSCTRRPRRSGRSRPCCEGSTGWCSPPASARTPPRFGSGFVRPLPGSASSWTTTRMSRKGPRISRSGSRVSAWVIPTNEELIIARHTGVLLGLLQSPRPNARRAQRASLN